MRLAKYLAHAGIASRRKSEEIIQRGLVEVNGKIVKDPAFGVEAHDRIFYQGRSVRKEEHAYYLFHKPAGVTVTLADRHAEKTLQPFLKNIEARVVPAGRLDVDSTGLLILTNDGELTHRLTHPRYHVLKTYEVCASGSFPEEELLKMKRGIEEDGDFLKVYSVSVLEKLPGKTVLEINLAEGKKREIRRILEVLGHTTISLKRVQMGPISLGALKSGFIRKLSKKEIELLKESVELLSLH